MADTAKKLLIVDKDSAFMQSLIESLRANALEATTATPAEVASLDAISFRAALINLERPPTPGANLAKKLRARHPAIKIFFMASYTAEDVQDAVIGCKVFVKPFDVAELAKLV